MIIILALINWPDSFKSRVELLWSDLGFRPLYETTSGGHTPSLLSSSFSFTTRLSCKRIVYGHPHCFSYASESLRLWGVVECLALVSYEARLQAEIRTLYDIIIHPVVFTRPALSTTVPYLYSLCGHNVLPLRYDKELAISRCRAICGEEGRNPNSGWLSHLARLQIVHC